MSELDPFEARFAAAYRRYLAEPSVEVDPLAVARRVAAAAPRRQGLLGFRPFGLTPAMAWILLLTGLLLALVVGGLAAGARHPEQAFVIAPQTTVAPASTSPSASTSPRGTPAPAGSMTTPRFGHVAALLLDGRILVAGGYGSNKILASAELYDPATGRFSPTGAMSAPRAAITAVRLADGRVLVAGGDSPGALASAELYDPRTGTFSPTGSMSSPRVYYTATLLSDGRVLVAGGANGSGWVRTAEIYDPATGTFSQTGSMNTARWSYTTATLLADGRVLIAGGLDPIVTNATGASIPLASAELYDPTTGTFSPTGALGTARSEHTATLLPDGRVLAAGGRDGSDSGNSALSAELYDPATGTFSPTGPLTNGHARHTATLLADGRVLIAAGDAAGFVQTTSAELYDPATGTFSTTGSMTTARVLHAATLLDDGRVLITGGYGDSMLDDGVLASAELYDPATGTFGPAGP